MTATPTTYDARIPEIAGDRTITRVGRLHRAVAGWGLVLAGIPTLVAVTIDDAADGGAEQLRSIADQPGTWLVANALRLLMVVLVVPGLFAILQLLRGRPRGAILSHVGIVLTLLGMLGTVGFVAGNFLLGSMAAHDDRAAMLELYDAIEQNTGLMVLFILALLVRPLGLLLTCIGLRRAGIVSAVPLVLMVGYLVSVFSHDSQVVETISHGLVAAALAIIGIAVLRSDDAAWR